MENIQTIRKALQNSIFEVFEKMFFVFLENSGQKSMKYRWAVSIGFTGRKSGMLVLYFSEDISSLMVRNMLSLSDGEVTQRLREDCIKESVNMVCGDFLRNYNASFVFDLSLPTLNADADGTLLLEKEDAKEMMLTFESDRGMLGAVLTLS